MNQTLKGDACIRQVQSKDLKRCFEIETLAYGGDEAASEEKISKRIEQYPDGFIVLESSDNVVGFINSGATHVVDLSDEPFKELIGHDPTGLHIVVMSVAVHPAVQRSGFATQMMAHFVKHMRELGKLDISLICQTELIGMYSAFGYQYLGESASNHGGLSWHEMRLVL